VTEPVPAAVTEAPRPAAWRTWLRRVGPYAVTALVVAAILRQYRLSDIIEEMRAGHALRMLPLPLVLPFLLLVPVSLCDRIVLRGVLGRGRFLDIARAKAGTAVLLTLGYAFSGGGYGVWLSRAAGARAARATGIVVYIMMSDLAAVCGVAGASMWLGGLPVPPTLLVLATALFALQTLFILVGPTLPEKTPRVFAAWRSVRPALGLLQMAGRTANILLITLFAWLASRAFGLDIPLSAMAMYMPVILLVGSLPINVAGLGAAQAAWLLLLPWATGPQLLAFQFLWQLFLGAAIVLRGLPFVRRVIAEIDTGS
jgi:hypothetical protein